MFGITKEYVIKVLCLLNQNRVSCLKKLEQKVQVHKLNAYMELYAEMVHTFELGSTDITCRAKKAN